jgi:NAD(P)-dependent dehydrogenase (short-subunit alcohol dehydrogenase family)
MATAATQQGRRRMNSVVVTGVTTGIGWGCAKVLLSKGFRVFGSVRKEADAARLREQWGANFEPLLFDVTDEAAVSGAARQVRAALSGTPLFGLVNNAGIAVPGPLLHLPIAAFRQQLEVNVVGQLIVTQAFAPLCGAAPGAPAPKGRIVNITSVGGTSASPFVGAYNSSKFAFEGLSEALRRELMLFGVDVITVAPGAVRTPIWDKAEAIDVSQYESTAYGPALRKVRALMLAMGQKGLSAEAIGEAVHRALTVRAPKARYVVTPDPVQNLVVNTLPRRLVDRIIARQLGLAGKV